MTPDMQRLLTTIFPVLLTILYYGQNTTSILSGIIEKASDASISRIDMTTDTLISVFSTWNEQPSLVQIDCFDADLQPTISKTIETDFDEIIHEMSSGSHLFLFGMIHHASEDEIQFVKLNKSLETVEQKSVLRVKSNGGYHAVCDVAKSPDQSKLAIIAAEGYSPNGKEIIHVALLDSIGDLKKSSQVLTGITSQKRSYNALSVNNEGVAYIIKRERNKGGDKYYVFSVNSNGTEHRSNIHLKSRNIVDMEYRLDTLGNLFLAGYYAPPYKSYFEGIYIKKIDQECVEQFSKEYLLNENIILSFQSKKDIKDMGYGLARFRSTELKWVDNHLLLLAEHRGSIIDNKNGNIDYRKGFVITSFSDKGGFLYSSAVLTEQTDPTDKGDWSSPYLIHQWGSPLLLFNYIGDGAKKVKDPLPENAGVHLGQITLKNNGMSEETTFAPTTSVKNYALLPNVKNKTTLPLFVLESKERNEYALGLFKK